MKNQKNKRVLLHIGGYKTGSTAIQRYCHSHRNELEQAGIHYLTNARPKHSDPSSHSMLPASLLQMVGEPTPKWYQEKANPEQILANCRSEIQKTKAPAILVSSEEFAVLPLCSKAKQQVTKALLAELLEGTETEVLLYVRPPLQFAVSWYNQLNKGVVPRKRFSDFFLNLDPHRLIPNTTVAFWSDVNPVQSVRVFDYTSHHTDVTQHFLKELGCSLPDLRFVSDHDMNPGLQPDAMEKARLTKIFAQYTGDERSEFLFSSSLSSDSGKRALAAKCEHINIEYQRFCERHGFNVPERELCLEAIASHESLIHDGNIPTPSKYAILAAKLRASNLAKIAKLWLRRYS